MNIEILKLYDREVFGILIFIHIQLKNNKNLLCIE